MKKDWKKLLDSFTKSNTQRKSKLAKKAGYDNFEDYRTFLKNKVSKKSEKASISSEMVIAFDTTGSMASYIEEVKKHVSSLIPELFKQNKNLKLSIVAFGDYCDMTSKKIFGKAYQVIDLTDDENQLIKFVNNTVDTHGCDYDEFYELVIRKINTETSWSKNSNKSVLFIGDCGPHNLGYTHKNLEGRNTIDWRVECKEAKKLGIVYDTFSISSYGYVDFYKEISKITGGLHLPFSSSSKTSQVIKMSSLARGGNVTTDSFKAMENEISGDAEMESTYAMYKSIIK